MYTNTSRQDPDLFFKQDLDQFFKQDPDFLMKPLNICFMKLN